MSISDFDLAQLEIALQHGLRDEQNLAEITRRRNAERGVTTITDLPGGHPLNSAALHENVMGMCSNGDIDTDLADQIWEEYTQALAATVEGVSWWIHRDQIQHHYYGPDPVAACQRAVEAVDLMAIIDRIAPPDA